MSIISIVAASGFIALVMLYSVNTRRIKENKAPLAYDFIAKIFRWK